MIQFGRSLRYLFFALLLSATAVLYGFKGVGKQPSGALLVSHPVAVEPESEGGMPERGSFLILYAYQGQPIEPDISVTLNGETIASLNQLNTVSWTTFVDLDTEKGDEAVIDARFMDDGGIVTLHNNFGSLTTGYWANQFNINFYLRDEDGNFVEHLGTMSIAFYLFPPFEGFALDADPGRIAPGEESRVSMESIELPDEPVIIPDNTSIDMRLSPNGKRLGGYAIPLLGVEGVEEIINFPYGFLANVPLYYRAYPDSTLLEGTSEEVQLGVFSHFNTSIAGQTEVEVSKGDINLKIISPTEETENFKISGEPAMPQIIVQAKLENFSEGKVEFHWEYKVEYSLSRYGSRYDLCDRTGMATFTGISSAQNSEISSWQVMFEEENAKFSYVGMTRDCSDFRDGWDGAGEVLIGGQTTVTVTAETASGSIYTDTVTANKILGSNPSVSEVKSGLNLKEQVVAYKETWFTARWKHFNIADRDLQYNRIGMPAYGYPNGFGLFQIDNPPSNEERLWNWRSNRKAGVNLLEEKRIDAEGWPNRIRRRANNSRHIGYQNTPDFETEKQLWKETFQRYNGGHYWDWKPEDELDPDSGGEWHVNERASGYGEEAWELYGNVKNGNFPVNWD